MFIFCHALPSPHLQMNGDWINAPKLTQVWSSFKKALEGAGKKSAAQRRKKRCVVFSTKPSTKDLGHRIVMTVAEFKAWAKMTSVPISPICDQQRPVAIRAPMWSSGLPTTNHSARASYCFRVSIDWRDSHMWASQLFWNLLSTYMHDSHTTPNRVHSIPNTFLEWPWCDCTDVHWVSARSHTQDFTLWIWHGMEERGLKGLAVLWGWTQALKTEGNYWVRGGELLPIKIGVKGPTAKCSTHTGSWLK